MTDNRQQAAVEAHPPEHQLERLIFFSDAVFAIVITLLIIEIRPPHLPYGSSAADQLRALAGLIPHFVGFFISFAVIAAFWAGHHRAFGMAMHWSPRLLFPNMALLCAVAFIPFATAYMSSNMGQLVPTVLYNVVLLATGLLNLWLIGRAVSPPVVGEGVDPVLAAKTQARGWGVTIGALVAIAVAFVHPLLSQFSLATIPLWLRLAMARAERRARKA